MIDEALVRQARIEVAARLTAGTTPPGNGEVRPHPEAEVVRVEQARAHAGEFFRRHAQSALRAGQHPLTIEDEEAHVRAVLDSLFGLAGFQRHLDDAEVEDIWANGCDEVFVRRVGGAVERVGPVAASDEELVALVAAFAVQYGLNERQFNPSSPSLSLTLPDGSRLHAIMSVCPRPTVTIARRRLLQVSLRELVRLGAMTDEVRELLRAALAARLNMTISGGPGAGKTTLLNASAGELDPGLRIVTIEDPIELQLHRDPERHPNVVPLEVRRANVEGAGELTARDLLREALHMRPDVIMVGEVRGDEVIPMLNAMSAGNVAGSMCTIHGHSPQGAIQRLISLCSQAPERLGAEAGAQLIATATNLIVHLDKVSDGRGGVRRAVSSILEVDGVTEDGRGVATNPVFAPGPDGQAVPHSPFSDQTKRRLSAAGFDLGRLSWLEGGWR